MAQFTTALANDFNTVRNIVANNLGTGSGTKGYGSPVSSFVVAPNGFISATEFTALANDINACYRHITNANASLAPVVANSVVTWANFVTYQAAATYINNNSDTNGGAVSTPSNSVTLPAGWGNASGNEVATMNGTLTFASAEAMRFFFNQANSIRMTGSGSGGTDIKGPMFSTLAGSINLNFNQTNYRTSTGANQTAKSNTNPYGYSGPVNFPAVDSQIRVAFGAPSGNTISFSIICFDTGDDNVVESDVTSTLVFTITRTVSNTVGTTAYDPTVTFGSWSYSAS
jgi:hypothetical protein